MIQSDNICFTLASLQLVWLITLIPALLVPLWCLLHVHHVVDGQLRPRLHLLQGPRTEVNKRLFGVKQEEVPGTKCKGLSYL